MQISTPAQVWRQLKKHIRPEWKTAFLSAALMGVLIHLPMMLSDIPNHDGLDSMYFDQNMITSGRWFLSVACGFSSYYTLPWVISVLAVLFLAFSSAALVEFLEVRSRGCIILISGLLVSFPAVASTFAYVYTMDGYMLALLLAVLSVLLTARRRFGFLGGAVCLAFSMGIYQSYLPFAVLLSIYGILMLAMSQLPLKEKIQKGMRFCYMGIAGVALYYGILRILLKIEGKTLDTYQGISGMGAIAGADLPEILKNIYRDFFSFTLKGNVLYNNIFTAAALAALLLLTAGTALALIVRRKWWKSPWFYFVLLLLAAGLPAATNLILAISPSVTYHLLMRYQWVMFLILPAAFVSRYGIEPAVKGGEDAGVRRNAAALCAWALLLSMAVLTGSYAVTDHIAYSNLEKRYEKTYAYCLRLLDRIEQTEGYYQGIPIAMVGVVGDEAYPLTDITQEVTGGITGMSGDVLLYRGDNYELFIRNYLGATLNILPADAMEEAYYAEFYNEMEPFPAADSIRIVDGILYLKTENMH